MLNDGSKKEWLIVLVKLDNSLICDCFDIPLHKLRRLVTIVELNATFYYRKLNIQTVFFVPKDVFLYLFQTNAYWHLFYRHFKPNDLCHYSVFFMNFCYFLCISFNSYCPTTVMKEQNGQEHKKPYLSVRHCTIATDCCVESIHLLNDDFARCKRSKRHIAQ